MLHPVTLEGSRAAVVYMHRQRHGHGAFGVRRPLAVVLVDVQIIGDDAKLLASHLKNFVVVDRVYRCVSARLGVHGRPAICAGHVTPSTAKLWSCSDLSRVWVAHAARVLVSAARRNELFWS